VRLWKAATPQTEQAAGEPMRESSPTPPDKTARSDNDSNLPFGLGKGYVELAEVARPEQLLPAKATDESQDTLDPNTGVPE
jgi:hypothetical protein